MERVVAIVQARMGSTRLPGKVLMEIAGRPMLWHVVMNARRAAPLDEVIVATSTAVADDAVVEFCRRNDITAFRGSETDVLDRYYQAAQSLDAAIVVRLTADCPLLDPEVIDEVVSVFRTRSYDYVSNSNPPTFPDGLDTEAFSVTVLHRAWMEAKRPYEREHVTDYVRKHPALFRLGNVVNSEDLSSLRWTVNSNEDLLFVRAVYQALARPEFGMREILDLLKRQPGLGRVSAGVARSVSSATSIQEDHLR